jgi:hypothetical protein
MRKGVLAQHASGKDCNSMDTWLLEFLENPILDVQ